MLKFMTLIISLLASGGALAQPKVSSDAVVLDTVFESFVTQPAKEAMVKSAKDKQVDIVINSPGGYVNVGYELITQMELLRAGGVKIRCFVGDQAASMAFMLLLSCDERYATPTSSLMWHSARVVLFGVYTASNFDFMSRSLAATDADFWARIKAAMPKSNQKVLWQHWEDETDHLGAGLNKLSPGFFKQVTYNIPGLTDSLRGDLGSFHASKAKPKNPFIFGLSSWSIKNNSIYLLNPKVPVKVAR